MHLALSGHTSKARSTSLLATLLVLALSACGDSVTGVEATTDDFVATWDITSLLFTPAGGGTSVEALTGSGTITFRADLTYTLVLIEGSVQETESGTFSLSGSTLTLTLPGEDSDMLTVTAISSSSATLYSADDSYDFNDDDEETAATLTVTLQK